VSRHDRKTGRRVPALANLRTALSNIGSSDFELLPEVPEVTDDAVTTPAEPVPEPRQPERKAMSARSAIVAAAIEAAATPSQRRGWTRPRRPLVVAVTVPASSWVKAVESYFQGFTDARWLTFARTGSIKSRDKPDVGNDEVAAAIAKGRSVVGIAATVQMQPASLIAAADMTVRIASPDGGVLRRAMRLCLDGQVPRAVDDAVAAGLDLDDLVAAFRPGSTPSEAIARLRTAAAARSGVAAGIDLPDLETAVEYGAARTWGLALARDIADFRAGRITWAEIDRGAVLHSEPGFGKSFFARILARACGIPLVVFSIGELFASSRGDLDGVIKLMRSFFERAGALAQPVCLLFLDEIDALPNRATLTGRNEDWWLPLITDFLTQLDDSVGSREGVIVLAATNRPDAVDPALLRPGRLERIIEIGRPDAAGVLNILRFHLKQDLLGADLAEVSQLVEGSTAAEIMEVVRAARRTARLAKRPLTVGDLRGRIVGAENEDAGFLQRVALHEAGHAVSSVALGVGTLRRVQIRSQGRAGGHTAIEHAAHAGLATLDEVERHVTSVLAAGVAERLILGSASTGSGGSEGSDIAFASDLLSVLHASTAVTGNLLHRAAPDRALETVRADPQLRRVVGRHLRRLEKRAEAVVTAHRAAIEAVAAALVRTRHLSGDEVRGIVARAGPPAAVRPGSRRIH
jgi:cell division protease FtsH